MRLRTRTEGGLTALPAFRHGINPPAPGSAFSDALTTNPSASSRRIDSRTGVWPTPSCKAIRSLTSGATHGPPLRIALGKQSASVADLKVAGLLSN